MKRLYIVLYIVLQTIVLTGCSVNRVFEVNIEGKGIKSVYGTIQDGSLILKSKTRIGK